MKVTIHPSSLKGSVQIPPSKSFTQRAFAAALLRKGETVIHNAGKSNDDRAALDIIKQLGADISEIENGDIRINSIGEIHLKSGAEINFGESGLGARMFTPVIALSGQHVILNGKGSLLQRPMSFFEDILTKFGVDVKTNHGKLPIEIVGKFEHWKAMGTAAPFHDPPVIIDGSLSSQFLTGLLFALSKCPDAVKISVKNLVSKHYIDITINVLEQFGLASIDYYSNYENFTIRPKEPIPGIFHYTVENDWSAGAFILVAGALCGPIAVRGLDLNSVQADRAIVDAMMSANAGIAMEAKGIIVHPAQMNGFEFDATDCPDLFPPLVALAAYCKGPSAIKGVNRLIHKESNRAVSLQEEFGKMGVRIELNDDRMIIHGGVRIKGATLHSHYDHRIVMACAVAALKADSESVIEGAEAVNKSYPDFFEDLKYLGADVSLGNTIKLHE